MGTRSAIGVMHGDKAKVVYCHWDGYIEHNGQILLNHYDSARANHLVAMGDMSVLGREIEGREGSKHSFDTPDDGVCVFYKRDRKEDNVDFRVCFSDAEMFDTYSDCEYFYIMRDGVWYVSQGASDGWLRLEDEVAKLDPKKLVNRGHEVKALPNIIPQIVKKLMELENEK